MVSGCSQQLKAGLRSGSRYDPCEKTLGKACSMSTLNTANLSCVQCVVGDSSTVQHGSPFLKNWMAWLEANADVRYAGLD